MLSLNHVFFSTACCISLFVSHYTMYKVCRGSLPSRNIQNLFKGLAQNTEEKPSLPYMDTTDDLRLRRPTLASVAQGEVRTLSATLTRKAGQRGPLNSMISNLVSLKSFHFTSVIPYYLLCRIWSISYSFLLMTYFGEKRDRQRERELLSFEIGCKKERNLLLYIILHVSKCIS